jgi:hypothetical protein
MKTFTQSLGSLAVVLLFGTTALSAQSSATTTSFTNAGHHASAASGEASAASGAAVTGSAQAVAGVAAVPVWMSGVVVTGSGEVLKTVGNSAVQAGKSTVHGAEKMWDFASGDVASRPPMARERAVPPAPAVVRKAKDPSPAEALQAK